MEPIQFIDVNKLDSMQQNTVNRISATYYDKISRTLKNVTLKIHVKTHRKKYSIHIRAIAPKVNLEAKEEDFQLAKAMHKVFKNLDREIQHTLHSD